MDITIVQANLDRNRTAIDLLFQNTYERKTDIALISEPCKSKIRTTWFTDTNKDATIIIINPKLKAKNEETNCKGFVWIEVGNTIIYSCYVSPNIDIKEYETYLQDLGTSISKHNNKKVVIGGDFNSKSYVWGPNTEDKRGRILLEWMAQLDLTIQNTGNNPTFVRGKANSVIDLTLTTAKASHCVKNWRTSDEINLSPHTNIYYTVSAEIKDNEPTKTMPETHRGWKVDVDKLTEFGKKAGKLLKECRDISVANLMDAIKSAADGTFKRKKQTGRRQVYWWNSEIAAQRRKSLEAKRKMTRINGNVRATEDERGEVHNEYKREKKKLTKCIEQAKRQAWKDLCKEVDNNVWGDAYKIVTRKVRGTHHNPPGGEKQAEIAKQLFPNDRVEKRTILTTGENIPPFTAEELRDAANKIKNKKAPGPDLVLPEMT